MVFAGTGGAAAGEGLVEQLRIGDLVGFHPAPVGKRAAARPADLPGQQFDDAVVLTIVMRFDDAVFVAAAEPQQSGLSIAVRNSWSSFGSGACMGTVSC